MNWPITTGEVRSTVLPGVREHTLNNLTRLGKISVPVICGRRCWGPDHVLAAAKILGLDTIEVRRLCNRDSNAEAGK